METAAVVVSAVNGIEPVTQRMMEFARDRELCRLIVVNKIDSKDAKTEQVLADLRETFGRECLPLNLPADGGRAVVDCFFKPGAAKPDFSTVAAAHTEIIDQVVEIDEQLMALYLEQGEELTPEQLHDPFEQALREGHLVPVCFVSAETGAGIKELLEMFARLMPNPLEGNPPPFLKGEGAQAERVQVTPDPERHVIAHVFKVSIDPFVGRLGMFRVHQGTVRTGSQLFVGDARKPFKVAHLYQLQGKEHAEISRAIPGDICAVAKVDELHFDAVLHDSHDEDHYHLKSITFPPAMAGLAIEPERRGEEQKLSDALAQARRRRSVRARRASCEPERDRALRHGRPAPARDARAHGGSLRRALQDARAEHPVSRDDHASGARVIIVTRSRPAAPASSARCICASSRSSAARDSSSSMKSSAARFLRSSFPRSRRACGRC